MTVLAEAVVAAGREAIAHAIRAGHNVHAYNARQA
jgi:hypothetical protein